VRCLPRGLGHLARDPGLLTEPRPSRRPDVQGLRALAIILVVAYHAGLGIPGGFVGVDVFFVISGFVITSLLVNELERTGRLDLRAFYARRIRRLLPALALLVVVVAVVGILATPVGAVHTTAFTGIAASVFAANAYLFGLGNGYFDVPSSFDPLLHTWTLAVEEQFYVLFPTVLALTWWLARRRVALAAAVAALGVLSFALSLLFSSSHHQFAFYGSPTRAWEFASGALVALASPLLVRLPARFAEALGVLGLGAVIVGAFTIRGALDFPGAVALIPVLGTAAAIVAGTVTSSGAARLLGAAPAVWIGNLSYSWYLWHWPVIVFARGLGPQVRAVPLIAAALSLIPAWASYHYVENPIRFNPRIRGRRLATLAAACIAVPIVASVALDQSGRLFEHRPGMEAFERADRVHADVQLGCEGPTPLGGRRPRACGGATDEVVLIGDSNAGQFTEPIRTATHDDFVSLAVATYSACPFVPVDVHNRIADSTRCRAFVERSLAALLAHRPRLVVIGNSAQGAIEDRSIAFGGTTDPTRKARLWATALRRELTALSDAGIDVLVIQPIPIIRWGWNVAGCSVVRIVQRTCTTEADRAVVEFRRRRAVTANALAAHGLPHVRVLDFIDDLCSPLRCSTTNGLEYVYRDRNHLTVSAAEQLTTLFRAGLN
jgi:peptidoglycan/LPS O-acetylase OafA/YrhL